MCTAVEMLPLVSGKKPRISHPVTQQQLGEREREDDKDEYEMENENEICRMDRWMEKNKEEEKEKGEF